MTREEAIVQIEKLKSYCEYMEGSDENEAYVFDLDAQALDLALSTLCPPLPGGSGRPETAPSREWQAERESSANVVDTCGGEVASCARRIYRYRVR